MDTLDALVEDTLEILGKEFYDKEFYFSYSSLSKLMWNPFIFFQLYIVKHREKDKLSPALTNGKVIHALLLSEKFFKEQFVISPTNIPTGNQKDLIDKLIRRFPEEDLEKINLGQCQESILEIMKEINYYQKLTTDLQRLDKVMTTENINYWQFLKETQRRDLIDQKTYDYCLKASETIRGNPELAMLMGMDRASFDTSVRVINETEYKTMNTDMPFGLKGILDNLVIDHMSKVIRINDLKTTSKDLKDFRESIENYSYWMQAAIYFWIIGNHYKDLIEKGYGVEFRFIVIDQSLQSYAFRVTTSTMIEWTERLVGTMNKALYHYSERKYLLPYEFCRGEVVL